MDWRHPVYDCLYVACAEAADATLVTADDRLLRILSSHGSAARHIALAQVRDVLGS